MLGDRSNGLIDVAGLRDHGDIASDLSANPGSEHRMVVHDEHGCHAGSPFWLVSNGIVSRTSVPDPGSLVTCAAPPWRCIRATIESRTPCRSSATAEGSKPRPRSRTKTST